MMVDYHIGTLDEASLSLLQIGEPEHGGAGAATTATAAPEPRPIFLQPKAWTKAILSAKEKVSADTKLFTFDLEHAEQRVGLPVGQHLMMRLRDPVTREAIIRAYTPVSEEGDRGQLRVLIKVYRDTPERRGGRMTQALDAIPIGHFVDVKGPVGKFEYLGRGVCAINAAALNRGQHHRTVRRFVMVCAGSGVTPIFQVLRAVMADPDDATSCLVLDGNRAEDDILCREDLDRMAAANPHKCRLRYTLTRPSASWAGLQGRMDRDFFEREVGSPPCCDESTDGGTLVLVCGPDALEKSVRAAFTGMGWKDKDMVFF